MIDLRTLLDSNKILPHYLERKDKKLDSLPPVAVEFHWCASCNYNCVHCSYGERRKNRSKLSPEVINTTIEQLANMQTQAIYLSGGGGAFYAKKLGYLC